ncbi:hypothetical protein [Escherichia coli]
MTIIAEKAGVMGTAIKRVRQWSTMPDATLVRLIRPTNRLFNAMATTVAGISVKRMSVAIVKAGAIVTIIAEKAGVMGTAIKRVRQWSTMPDATLVRLIRPTNRLFNAMATTVAGISVKRMSVAIVKAGAIVTIIAEKAGVMGTAIKRVRQWSTMPDATLVRLIRPTNRLFNA